MAATTKLIVYNEALRELGGQPLLNLVTANTKLYELDGAFDHAVEYVLSKADWGFARRRALVEASSSTFPHYAYIYAKPVEYLRKFWVKLLASNAYQLDHAEVGLRFRAVVPDRIHL